MEYARWRGCLAELVGCRILRFVMRIAIYLIVSCTPFPKRDRTDAGGLGKPGRSLASSNQGPSKFSDLASACSLRHSGYHWRRLAGKYFPVRLAQRRLIALAAPLGFLPDSCAAWCRG
jgi:hypothetical protein